MKIQMSLDPHLSLHTSAPRTPRAIICHDVHKNRTQHLRYRTYQIRYYLPTNPTGARACCRPTIPHYFVAPFLLPSSSNLPFLLSLPPFPDYRATIAVTPPERREHAGTRRPCRRRAEGGRPPPHFAVPLLLPSFLSLAFSRLLLLFRTADATHRPC